MKKRAKQTVTLLSSKVVGANTTMNRPTVISSIIYWDCQMKQLHCNWCLPLTRGHSHVLYWTLHLMIEWLIYFQLHSYAPFPKCSHYQVRMYAFDRFPTNLFHTSTAFVVIWNGSFVFCCLLLVLCNISRNQVVNCLSLLQFITALGILSLRSYRVHLPSTLQHFIGSFFQSLLLGFCLKQEGSVIVGVEMSSN